MLRRVFCFVLFLALATPAFTVNAYTLRPQWVPQAQFAGYYMAAKQGFYKEAGIDLEIKNGGPGIVALQEVSEGKTDFATGWLLSALRMRATGQNIVLIGQVIQQPALLLVAKKSSGIDSVEKFAGQTLGVWPGDFQVPPKALIRKERIRDIKITQQGFTMDGFLKDEIKIASAMRYNEYQQLLESGLKDEDLIIFNYADLGLKLPEDGVYVTEEFLAANSDACVKFVEATKKGWEYAFAHKDETVAHMTELANATDFKTTPEKQMAMLNEMEKIVTPANMALAKTDFGTALEALKSTRMIKKDVPYEAFTAPSAQ